MKRTLIFTAALAALVFAQAALSYDGAVGDTYRETFELFDASGNTRADAALANFTTSFKRDGAVVSESASFRNHSTGAYDMVWTPSAAGWYSGAVQYNNTSVVTWRALVYARDTDDLAQPSDVTTAHTTTDGLINGIDDNPWDDAARTLTAGTKDAEIDAIKAATDNLPTDPADESNQQAFRVAMKNHTGVSPADYMTDVSGLATPSDVTTAHSTTDGLINDVDDNPWDDPSRSLTDKTGFSLLADQTGVALGSVADVTNPVALAYGSMTGIDARLSQTHGPGYWNANGNVTVVPFQGSVSYETATSGADVHISRGDSVSIPYTSGMDLTGWTVWFGVKETPADDAYAIGPKEITSGVTDVLEGSGLIDLSPADTGVQPRRYVAEIEIRNGPYINTVLRFRLWVDADVVR